MRKTTMLGMLVVIGMVLGMVACSSEDDRTSLGDPGVPDPNTQSGEEHPPANDVSVVSCDADATGWIRAKGMITNNSSKPSTYLIRVEFVGADGVRYAEGVASSSAVASGQQAEWEANGLTEAREGTSCNLIDVVRYAA